LQNHARFHGTVNPHKPASSKAFRRFHDENHPHSSTKTQRFDLDGNGELDLREWELARSQARREVARIHSEQCRQADLNTLRQPEDGRLYLISGLPPDKLSRRYRWWSIAHLVMFFCALSGMAIALKSAT